MMVDGFRHSSTEGIWEVEKKEEKEEKRKNEK